MLEPGRRSGPGWVPPVAPEAAVRQPGAMVSAADGGSAAVLLRPGVLEESDEIAAVFVASRRASVPAIPPLVHDDEDVRRWLATQMRAARATWVAEAEGALVALMIVGDGWLQHLYVAPGWTGRGIGSRLVALAQTDQGALQLWAFQANHGARRFYERHGFEAVEETDGRANEERTPDVRYEWSAAAARG
jgi:GNAT superfamily N-acetyltransferase